MNELENVIDAELVEDGLNAIVGTANLNALEEGDPQVAWLLVQANNLQAQSDRALSDALMSALESGDYLTKAKAKAKHGTWLQWLEQCWEFHPRIAQRNMKLARERNRVLELASQSQPDSNAIARSHLTITEATRLLAAADVETEEDSNAIGRSHLDEEEEAEQPAKTPNLRSLNPTNELYTPIEIVERLIRFMQIDLDPCCNPGKPIIPAAHHIRATDKEHGLILPWSGSVFINPPYSPDETTDTSLKDWAVHGMRSLLDCDQQIWLVPNYSAEEWFEVLARRGPAICTINHRLRFIGSDGKPMGSARFSSVLMYFGDDPFGFADCFGDLGRVWLEMGGEGE